MAYWDSSVAYDLSAYQQPKQEAKPDLKMLKSQRSLSAAVFNSRVLGAFAVVVVLLSLMIYNQVQLTETTGEINNLTRQLEELQSQNTEMMSVLESTVSPRMIGERARDELGMNRLDKYQTVHIYLEQEDRIELTENSPNPSVVDRFYSAITSAITRIQEYIGIE